MNWKNPQLHFLGLDSKEIEILMLLRDPLSIQNAARKCKIPRTTIAFVAKKLTERGFIEKVMIGKRYKYYSISEERFNIILENISGSKKEYTPLTTQASSNKKVSYYQGLKNIIRLQADFLSSYKDERVYAIQPNKSWLSLHSKVDDEHVIHVNEIIRNNNLILEGIIEHDAYEHFKAANKKKFIKLARSFGDRMADYASAPAGFMTDQVEMWIIKDTAMFIDWREEVAIKIIDAHMVYFLHDMFKLVKGQGRKIDHNQSIREVLG